MQSPGDRGSARGFFGAVLPGIAEMAKRDLSWRPKGPGPLWVGKMGSGALDAESYTYLVKNPIVNLDPD